MTRLVPIALAVALVATAPAGAGGAAPGAHVERFRYRATWNTLPVADAELLVQPGAGAIVLRGRAQTTEALDLLWRMRDSFEATVGVRPTRPARFVLRQRENGRRRETTIVAAPQQLTATVERRHRRPRRAEVARAPNLHDPASVAWAIRTLTADAATAASYDVVAGTKVYTLRVAPAGTETVAAAGRAWRAHRFRLALRRDAEDGDGRAPAVQEADLWISASPERVPLRLRSRTFWGWVMVELVG